MKNLKFNSNLFGILLLFLLVGLILSCAETESLDSCLEGKKYGFFSGLIHGFITPVSFIVSVFNQETAIYAVNNTGAWYDFGFLLGSGGWGFLAGNRSKK